MNQIKQEVFQGKMDSVKCMLLYTIKCMHAYTPVVVKRRIHRLQLRDGEQTEIWWINVDVARFS